MTVSRLWLDLNVMSADNVLRDFPHESQMVTCCVFLVFLCDERAQTLGRNKRPNKTSRTLLALELVAGRCNASKFADEKDLSDAEAQSLEAQQRVLSSDATLTLRSASLAFPSLAAQLGKTAADSQLTMRSALHRLMPEDPNRKVEVCFVAYVCCITHELNRASLRTWRCSTSCTNAKTRT